MFGTLIVTALNNGMVLIAAVALTLNRKKLGIIK